MPNYQDVTKYRQKRFRHFEELIAPILKVKDKVRIIDIGGTRGYWDLASDELKKRLSITLVNYEVALNLKRVENDILDVEYHEGDGCNLHEFADGSFDLAHSNSVIEHVRTLSNMARFAEETRRVGNAYFVQTPYLWFPYDPHYRMLFIHWLPRATRIMLTQRFNFGMGRKGHIPYMEALDRVEGVELIDKTMMKALFPDGTMQLERFALFTKSVMMSRPYTNN